MKSPFFQQFFDKILHYHRLVEDYKRASEVSPDAAMSYVNWGIELGSDGKLEEAIERFRQAAEIAPGRFEPYLNWGIALAKQNDLVGAVEKFERATEQDREEIQRDGSEHDRPRSDEGDPAEEEHAEGGPPPVRPRFGLRVAALRHRAHIVAGPDDRTAGAGQELRDVRCRVVRVARERFARQLVVEGRPLRWG